jgi:F-type H+-transporting ATPase subunit alpha
MQLNPSEISELIKDRIKNFESTAEARTEGTIVSLMDGIARIHGLADVMSGEMIGRYRPYSWSRRRHVGRDDRISG